MAQEKDFETRVTELINQVRPMLQADGGDCEIVGFVDKSVKLRLRGACAGCPGAKMTLKMGIERYIKERIPEFNEVIQA